MAPRFLKFIRNQLSKLSCVGRRRSENDQETTDPPTSWIISVMISDPPTSCSEADAPENGPAICAEPALPPLSVKSDSTTSLPPTFSLESLFETPKEEKSGETSDVDSCLTATSEKTTINCTTNKKSANERIHAFSEILSDMHKMLTDMNYWCQENAKQAEIDDGRASGGISTTGERCELGELLESITTSPEVNMTTEPIPSTSTNYYRREISALLELQKYDHSQKPETPIASVPPKNFKRPKGKKLKRIRNFFRNLF